MIAKRRGPRPAARLTFVLAAIAALLLLGCATGSRNLYYWGDYEDAIYDMYLEPGKTSLTDEILRLKTDVEKAAAHGMSVPPGLHAHLGYLYTLEGDDATALVHFQTEKALFPESTVFIDGLITRMRK
jgi:hypothetical protein